MNNLPDDVLIYMALTMDIPDVLMLCNVNSKFNKVICDNQKYWMNKLLNDFPEDFKIFDIKNYGPDYKNYYKTYAYTSMLIEVSIDQYNDLAEEYEFINASKDLTFHRNTDVKKLVFNIIDDLFNTIDSWGLYTISVNDDVICEDIKNLYDEYFEGVNADTSHITINFASQEFVDETDDTLDVLLENSIRKYKN